MKCILLVLGFMLAGHGAVFARLGENEAKLRERYGVPVPDSETAVFPVRQGDPLTAILTGADTRLYRLEKQSLFIAVTLKEGRSIRETFGGDMQEDWVDRLLEKLADGKKWSPWQKDWCVPEFGSTEARNIVGYRFHLSRRREDGVLARKVIYIPLETGELFRPIVNELSLETADFDTWSRFRVDPAVQQAQQEQENQEKALRDF